MNINNSNNSNNPSKQQGRARPIFIGNNDSSANNGGQTGMASSAPAAGYSFYIRNSQSNPAFNANGGNGVFRNPTLLPTSEVDPTLTIPYGQKTGNSLRNNPGNAVMGHSSSSVLYSDDESLNMKAELTEADLFGSNDLLNPADMDINDVDDIMSPQDLSPYAQSPVMRNNDPSKAVFKTPNNNGVPVSAGGANFNQQATGLNLPIGINRGRLANPTFTTPAISFRGVASPHAENMSHHPISMSLPSTSSMAGSMTRNPQQMLPMHPDQIDLKGTAGPEINQLEKRRRRRESHNMVERRRRDNINERIQELSHLIPEESDLGARLHKGQILQRAAEYIRHLQDVVYSQTQELKIFRPDYEPPSFNYSARKGSFDFTASVNTESNADGMSSNVSTPQNFNNLTLGD